MSGSSLAYWSRVASRSLTFPTWWMPRRLQAWIISRLPAPAHLPVPEGAEVLRPPGAMDNQGLGARDPGCSEEVGAGAASVVVGASEVFFGKAKEKGEVSEAKRHKRDTAWAGASRETFPRFDVHMQKKFRLAFRTTSKVLQLLQTSHYSKHRSDQKASPTSRVILYDVSAASCRRTKRQGCTTEK